MLAEILHTGIKLMGLFGDIAEKAVSETALELSMSKKDRVEKAKWGALFAVCALAAMAAFAVQKNSMKGADLLGGRKTIERFMHSNVTAMVILLAAAVGFVIVCFKTWKGRRSSIYQLIFTVGAGVVIVFSGVSILKSIHNIQIDLDSPLTLTRDSYVLCKEGSNYMLTFDQEGTQDSVLLVIPQEKYKELKNGVISKRGYLSRSWRLIENENYRNFTDAVYYESKISVTYYRHSIIYEDCSLIEDETHT
ncbi:hypothetical protein SAMN02910317_00113 [Ruminococcaceae bacterium FB2012]|nr:hypothetical protein SAMN02910317_00113 [Ruminococcaceae bacterium FB2012]